MAMAAALVENCEPGHGCPAHARARFAPWTRKQSSTLSTDAKPAAASRIKTRSRFTGPRSLPFRSPSYSSVFGSAR